MENEKSALAGRRLENSSCPRCGTEFRCGAVGKDEKCWCFTMPRLEAAQRGGSCYCPNCLTELTTTPESPAG